MSLSREIINQIFIDLGVVPNDDFGTIGMIIPELKSEKTLSGTYEDNTEFHCPIWSGKVKIDEKSILRCVVCDMSDQGIENTISEFGAIFQFNEMPRYGIRLLMNTDDAGLFLSWDQKKWQPVSIYWQSKILSGMELMVSHGLLWEQLLESNDLIECLTSLSGL